MQTGCIAAVFLALAICARKLLSAMQRQFFCNGLTIAALLAGYWFFYIVIWFGAARGKCLSAGSLFNRLMPVAGRICNDQQKSAVSGRSFADDRLSAYFRSIDGSGCLFDADAAAQEPWWHYDIAAFHGDLLPAVSGADHFSGCVPEA